MLDLSSESHGEFSNRKWILNFLVYECLEDELLCWLPFGDTAASGKSMEPFYKSLVGVGYGTDL